MHHSTNNITLDIKLGEGLILLVEIFLVLWIHFLKEPMSPFQALVGIDWPLAM